MVHPQNPTASVSMFFRLLTVTPVDCKCYRCLSLVDQQVQTSNKSKHPTSPNVQQVQTSNKSKRPASPNVQQVQTSNKSKRPTSPNVQQVQANYSFIHMGCFFYTWDDFFLLTQHRLFNWVKRGMTHTIAKVMPVWSCPDKCDYSFTLFGSRVDNQVLWKWVKVQHLCLSRGWRCHS